jgi:hypothetical protein
MRKFNIFGKLFGIVQKIYCEELATRIKWGGVKKWAGLALFG